MITERQKRLVQESWADVVPIAETAAELFYGHLFELDPSLKAMFAHSSMKEQGKKLTQMITVAVKGLDHLGTIVPAVEALERQHVGYGVQDSHYETVGVALLWTLEQGLDERFTPETAAAWTTT